MSSGILEQLHCVLLEQNVSEIHCLIELLCTPMSLLWYVMGIRYDTILLTNYVTSTLHVFTHNYIYIRLLMTLLLCRWISYLILDRNTINKLANIVQNKGIHVLPSKRDWCASPQSCLCQHDICLPHQEISPLQIKHDFF